MTGIELIAIERRRQIRGKRWTQKHDDSHQNSELARAAAMYALPPHIRFRDIFNLFWPWSKDCFKPNPCHRIRELTKAGALIAAEIDRLQRLAQQETDNA